MDMYNDPAHKPPPHFCPMLACTKGGGGGSNRGILRYYTERSAGDESSRDTLTATKETRRYYSLCANDVSLWWSNEIKTAQKFSKVTLK